MLRPLHVAAGFAGFASRRLLSGNPPSSAFPLSSRAQRSACFHRSQRECRPRSRGTLAKLAPLLDRCDTPTTAAHSRRHPERARRPGDEGSLRPLLCVGPASRRFAVVAARRSCALFYGVRRLDAAFLRLAVLRPGCLCGAAGLLPSFAQRGSCAADAPAERTPAAESRDPGLIAAPAKSMRYARCRRPFPALIPYTLRLHRCRRVYPELAPWPDSRPQLASSLESVRLVMRSSGW